MEATFKTRARTLDMLGRQQIAGIPTAVSELFKNAHDANAERVEADYYRSDRLFVLRDDGVGMDRDEFVDRWLTIATETSLIRRRAESRVPPSVSSGRPVLGEKGIGRLAIATIAPQLLVLTRAHRDGTLSDLTAVFLSWRIFEFPQLNLQDIRIPLRTFPGGTLPCGEEIVEMVDKFQSRNECLRERVNASEWERMETELANFKVDPLDLTKYLDDPTLLGDGHGTHFYLRPASPNLEHDIAGDRNSDVAAPLQKALLGFTAPSFSAGRASGIRTAFRDHRANGTCEDIIGASKFFTSSEYDNADHQVTGRFDEYGQFKGSVSIYGQLETNHVIPWSGGRGKKTSCGPFHIRFAAIEGLAANSKLSPEEHGRVLAKTKKIGGLYVYRDGVRIQPYGNTDYDWLEIELRRTKSASYYYFSYRQMFGVVEVDSTNNPELREKAGREGFRENKAYFDLRRILKNFLVQVAADFFREDGVHGKRFAIRKREMREAKRHLQARARQVTARRTKFRKDLTRFFHRLETEDPLNKLARLGVEIEDQIKEEVRDLNRNRSAHRIIKIESKARKSLHDIEATYRVIKPRIGISKALQKEWKDYQESYDNLVSTVRFIRGTIESIVTKEMIKLGGDVSAKSRMESALKDLGKTARRETRASLKAVEKATDAVQKGIQEIAGQCRQHMESAIRATMADFARRDIAGMNSQQLIEAMADPEEQIRKVKDNVSRRLDALHCQLAAVDLTGTSSVVDQLEAVEQNNITLREQAVADLQLAQIGMAIEIISHEFGAAIRSVRLGLGSLKAWADVNQELMSLYRGIRGSFDHLDGYLTLFTPLQRRLYRKAVVIHGWEIYEFLNRLFGQRLARHKVELTRTDAFANATVRGYPSSFYPVFVNLVDNSIYWVAGQNDRKERRIQFDYSGQSFRISDSGPGVHDRDRDDIFEIGFTRKPGGRGMGLHIAKATLREVGYDLILEPSTLELGATFLIVPINEQGKNDDVN